MAERQRFGWKTLLCLVLVLAAAAAARGGYLVTCVEHGYGPTPLAVQDAPRPTPPTDAAYSFRSEPNELDALAQNISAEHWFGCDAPLAPGEELSAHRAPGYPWLLSQLLHALRDRDKALHALRWAQALLGTLTAGLYFLFAWQAFRGLTVASLAGLFCAAYPFWIVNVAEVEDGTVTAFVLALALVLGSWSGARGGELSAVLFGLALAGLAMLRAALLPFALVACLWYLLRCRTIPRGWLCALLALLGLVNGLAPWSLRNYRTFHDAIPISDATYLHLWVGNNALATGGPQDEKTLRAALDRLPEAARGELLAEKDQTRRYRLLSADLVGKIQDDPNRTVSLRVWALLDFVFGEDWFARQNLCRVEHREALPPALEQHYPVILSGSLLALLLFGLLGWRWTYGWRRQTRLATLALVWVPLPYILGHAEALSGPRLPLDGVLLCYAAFALCCLVPGLGRRLFRGAPGR